MTVKALLQRANSPDGDIAQMLQRLRQKVTRERRGWLMAIVAIGAACYGWGNGHTTQGAVEHISQELGCEHVRADKSARVAKQAIVSAYSDAVPIPDPKSLPKDCPHTKE